MEETAILIGRFQVPELNAAYRQQIESLQQQHGGLVLVLAESPIPVRRENPLPLESRKAMIADTFPDLEVFSVKDHPLDTSWSQALDEVLEKELPGRHFVIYGTQDRFIRYYKGKHKTAALPDDNRETASADEEPKSKSFRNGMVYASGKWYPSVFPTVDVAVFRSERREILLGKKAKDGKWRLIGGFADPGDDGFTASAKREFREECGDVLISELAYEGSFRIDDWRYRFGQDKIITTLFSTDYISGNPQAADDLADLSWFSLSAVSEMISKDETAREHEQMFRFLLKKYRQDA